jgi:competence protein ComEA
MQNQAKKVSKSFLILSVIVLLVLTVSMPDAFAKEAKALVDLNTASQQELEGLKGVGPATAKKIIEHRPYKSVDELSKAGIPAKTIDGLKPFVTAGPAAATPHPSEVEKKPAQAPAAVEKAAAKASTAKAPTGPIDLNIADQKALESLPGIGPATATEIMKGRPYTSVDDLGRVKGMSKGKIEKLKGMVTVGKPEGAQPSTPTTPSVPAIAVPAPPKPAKVEPTVPKAPSGIEKKSALKLAPGEKVNINTANKEMLEALPGIGPAKAQAIIEGRPYQTPEDIMKVKGIKQGTFDKIKDQITVK